jgi:ubiquinone/menaquinone biosynthesis C-methylase UbiE
MQQRLSSRADGATAGDWNQSAGLYESVEATAARYARVAAVLVRMARLRAGMTVVDLACGPGTVAQEICRTTTPGAVAITAIDHSSEMLDLARARLPLPSIRFALSRAEEMAAVLPQPVDRVLCNAAFWQMNMRRVLRAVRGVLAADGWFVVSCPDLAPTDPRNPGELYARSRLAWMVLEARACIGRPYQPGPTRERISQADIVAGHAADCGFRLVTAQTISTQASVAGTLQFLQIPALFKASPLLAGLSPAEREHVLHVVAAELEYVEANVSPKLWRVMVFTPA